MRVQFVAYRYVRLNELEVLGVADETDKIFQPPHRSRAANSDSDTVLDVVSQLLSDPKRKPDAGARKRITKKSNEGSPHENLARPVDIVDPPPPLPPPLEAPPPLASSIRSTGGIANASYLTPMATSTVPAGDAECEVECFAALLPEHWCRPVWYGGSSSSSSGAAAPGVASGAGAASSASSSSVGLVVASGTHAAPVVSIAGESFTSGIAPRPIVVDVRPSLESELAEEVVEMADLDMPRFNPDKKSVHHPHTGEILGHIRPMKVDTPQECISIYCRLHGCAPPLKRLHQALPHREMIEWFRDGLHEVPRGKEHRTKHVAMFHERLCNHLAAGKAAQHSEQLAS